MERQPVAPNQEQQNADFSAWEQEFAAPAPEVMTTPEKTESITPSAETGVEYAQNTPVSPTAELLRKATGRLINLLDNRAATKDERAANRTEKYEAAKDKLRTYGSAALNSAYEVSITTASISYIAAGTSMDKVNIVRQKIVSFGVAARDRLHMRMSRKEAYAMDNTFNAQRQDAAYDSYSDNLAATAARESQEQAYESYEDNISYSQDHEEALAINDQKKKDQEAAFDSYESNIDTTQKRESQEAAFESYDGNIKYSNMLEIARERNARAEAARVRKAERRERRLEKFGKAREKGSELYNRAARGFKRFGRAALRGALRVRRTASAARQAWNQA